MRNLFLKLLALSMSLSVLIGCSHAPSTTQAMPTPDRLHVVATIFPAYDWVKQITSDQADVTLLLDEGTDLHSYQPTADDLVEISTCDLFIYIGGESDAWVEKALENAANPNRVTLNLMDMLGDAVKEEEFVEGMQASEHHHEHDDEEHNTEEHDAHEEDHEHEQDHVHEEEPESDEHIWLSLKNAKQLCQGIAEKIAELDAANSEVYMENLSVYLDKLSQLDAKYEAAVRAGTQKTLLFGDRFPFRYLVDDYDLDYYAAFSGCSAESEASFETVAFLSSKVDELKLPYVVTIEGGQHKLAETIINNTSMKDSQILTMDSMQSTTAVQVKEGATYLSAMEQNLKTLQAALQ